MDKKKIRLLIDKKDALFDEINQLNDKLIDRKTATKYELEDLWLRTDWETVINGRATDKTKKAFVDAQIRPHKEQEESVENTIEHLQNQVKIIDDKLKYLTGVNDD